MLITYTAVFGNTDPLQRPRIRTSVPMVCFTDDPRLKVPGWEVVRLPTQSKPTRASRMLKMRPHVLFPEATESLWLDANFVLLTDPQEIARAATSDLCTFRHRFRTRISDEAKEIIRLGKAHPDTVRRQLRDYQEDGFDTDENPQQCLGEHGVLYRRHQPHIAALSDMWAEQLAKYTLRDQLSLDYCSWKLGVPVGRFEGTIEKNQFVEYRSFKRPTNDY